MARPFLQRVPRERIEMTAGGELVHDGARLLKDRCLVGFLGMENQVAADILRALRESSAMLS